MSLRFDVSLCVFMTLTLFLRCATNLYQHGPDNVWRTIANDYDFVSIENFTRILINEDSAGTSSYLRFHHSLGGVSTQSRPDDIDVTVGKALDEFLISRPWWCIVDLEQSKYISLIRADARILPTLQVIGLSQNPPDCCLVPLRYHETPIDSYGNTAYDITNNKANLFWAIHGPFVLPQGNGYFPAFIDVHEACPRMNISNAFECLFLPFTNCTEALSSLFIDSKHPKSVIYSNATSTGKPVSHEEANKIIQMNHVNKRSTFNETVQALPYIHYSETFITGKTVVRINQVPVNSFFTYGYLFRMNYLFRQYVADDLRRFFSHGSYRFRDGLHAHSNNSNRYHRSNIKPVEMVISSSIGNMSTSTEIGAPLINSHKSKSSVSTSFPTDGDCVVIHIRRSYDRQIPGVDMNEWCRMFKYIQEKDRNSGRRCQYYNFTSQSYVNVRCQYFDDMGCNTAMPYGAISLQQYINASQILSNITVNLYIRTDNPKWLFHELEKLDDNYKKRYNFFIFTTHDNHRTLVKFYSNIQLDSDFLHITNNDIRHSSSYFAAIDIARKCNRGFVGHSGSAVTGFWLNNLCAYHAGVFGKCPPFFDFATTSGPKSWNKRHSH